MGIFINQASVDAGKVQVATAAPLGNYLQGTRYCANDKVFVVSAPVPITAPYDQGVRYDGNGALYIHDVDVLGVPPNIQDSNGLRSTIDGALLVTTVRPAARYFNGFPLSQEGYVCVA